MVAKATERQRAALEKATHKGAVAAVQSAEVQQPAAPKGATSATSAATPTAEAAGSADTSAPASAAAPAPDKAKPQPRYDSESFEAWAANNPEKAADIARSLFRTNADHAAWKTQFIKHQGKLRKLRTLENEGKATLETQRKAIEEGQALIAKQIEEQNGLVQPVMDLVGIGQQAGKVIKERLEAVAGDHQKADFNGLDFGAVDDLFEHVFGVGFDSYSRARARQGLKVSPADRALRLELERVRKENERLKAGTGTAATETTPATTPATPAAAAPAPKKDTRWMADELEDHPVTEVNDWQGKIQAILDEHVDPEDEDAYTIELEDAAEQVLAASRERLGATPAPAAKGKAGKRTPAPASRSAARTRAPEPEEDDDEAPKGFAARQEWAMQRAKRRAAGG